MATSIKTAHFLAGVTGIAKETMLVQTRRLGEQNWNGVEAEGAKTRQK